MHIKTLALATSLGLSVLTLAGCANTSSSGDVYRPHQAQTAQTFRLGTINAIRLVQIQAESRTGNLLGGAGGAVLGGLLGNQVGGGSGKQLATAAGILGGAAAGVATENSINRVDAWEMEIATDDGDSLIIVQKADREFNSGQRVRLISSGGKISVAPY